MNKILSISLIILLLFNLIGYRIVFQIAEALCDKKTEMLVDSGKYDKSKLVKIAVPLANPYVPDQPEFEPAEGEMTIDGSVYKLIKRKISEGYLILVCLPDLEKSFLKTMRDNNLKRVNDLYTGGAGNAGHPKTNVAKIFSSEYEPFQCLSVCSQQSFTVIHYSCISVSSLHSRPGNSPEQPPDTCV